MSEIFNSKKFWVALIGLVVAVAGEVGLDLSVDEIMAVLSPILAYILGQGLADFGKEAAKK